MSQELADKLKENFPKVFGKEAYRDIYSDGIFMVIQLKDNTSTYPFRIVQDLLIIGAVAELDIEEEHLKKILRLNEMAARELGFSQINYDADFEKDKKLAMQEGYSFEDKKYLGIKKLK